MNEIAGRYRPVAVEVEGVVDSVEGLAEQDEVAGRDRAVAVGVAKLAIDQHGSIAAADNIRSPVARMALPQAAVSFFFSPADR